MVAANDSVTRRVLAECRRYRRRDIVISVTWMLLLVLFVIDYFAIFTGVILQSVIVLGFAVAGLLVVLALVVLFNTLTATSESDYRAAVTALMTAKQIQKIIEANGHWKERQDAGWALANTARRFRSSYQIRGIPLVHPQLRDAQRIPMQQCSDVVLSYLNDVMRGDIPSLQAAKVDMVRVFLRCMGKVPFEVIDLRPWVPVPEKRGASRQLLKIRWGQVGAALLLFLAPLVTAVVQHQLGDNTPNPTPTPSTSATATATPRSSR